jgi:2-polyprenyl-3-methyl-5-hydroxy-6-metoxy-1,4-benzoquinol methylase
MEINSKEWWENEFESGNWVTGIDGNIQTKLFAEITQALLNPIIKKDIYENCRTLCDFGCAYGQALTVLEILFRGDIEDSYMGIDFSETAIKQCKENKDRFKFYANIDEAVKKIVHGLFDVIYCSNVLEHYENPQIIFDEFVENCKNYIILLVPYQQEPCGSHVFKFTKNYLNNLIYLYPEWAIVQMTEIGAIDNFYSPVPQMLVVYKKIF